MADLNFVLKIAYEMDEYGDYHTLPNVEVGDIVSLDNIWDGEGEMPENSYSYLLRGDKSSGDYINYCFEFIEDEEHSLDSMVKITDIELV